MKNAIVITAAVLVALLGGCAGCVASAYRTVTRTAEELDPFAERFVVAWNARDLDRLADLCGPVADRAAFIARAASAIDSAGSLSQRTLIGIAADRMAPTPSATAAYHVHGGRRDGVLRLTFVRRGDGWSLIDFGYEPVVSGSPPAGSTPDAA